MLTTFAIATSTPKDRVLDEVNQLQKEVDAVFLTAPIKSGDGHAELAAGSQVHSEAADTGRCSAIMQVLTPGSCQTQDQIVNFRDQAYIHLLAKFERSKAVLEKASQDRLTSDFGKGPLANMAQASKQYFELQRRLYHNFFRNLHVAGRGSITDESAIDRLNLKLGSSTALTLLGDDSKYQARFNLTHDMSSGNLDQIEYFFTPQNRADLEVKALKEVPNERHYAELIQFLVAQERITNLWAMDRMRLFSEPLEMQLFSMPFANRPVLNSCGASFFSFKTSPTLKTDYYTSLWGDDRYQEFMGRSIEPNPTMKQEDSNVRWYNGDHGLSSLVVPVTAHRPLVSNSILSKLLQDYFNHWPEYKTAVENQKAIDDQYQAEVNARKEKGDTNPVPIPAVSFKLLPDEYFDQAPSELLTEIDNQWTKTDSRSALTLANLPSDSWAHHDVATRISWEALHYQRKYLIDALVNEAKASKFDPSKKLPPVPRISYVVDHQDEARAFATELVDSLLNFQGGKSITGLAADYRRSLTSTIEKTLNSDEAHKILVNQKEERFQELAQRTSPAFTGIARAEFVIHNIERIYKAQKDMWIKKRLWDSEGGDGEDQLIYVPYHPYLYEDVILFTPDQLSAFFSYKLEYLQKLSGSTFTSVALDPLKSVVKDIQDNPVVMKGVKHFFGELSAQYTKVAIEKKLDLAKMNENITPLYDLIDRLLPAQYQEFQKIVEKAPELKTQHQKDVAVKLYVEAMSVMNLGAELLGADEARYVSPYSNHNPSPHREELSVYQTLNAENPAHQTPIFRVKSPMDLERVLRRAYKTDSPKIRTVQSISDQRIAANVLKAEWASAHPVLQIREGEEIDSHNFGDALEKIYHPGKLIDQTEAFDMLRTRLRIAQPLQDKLVTEVCDVDPHNYKDVAFKHIFLSSPVYRDLLMQEDPRFKSIDAAVVSNLKTIYEKVKDAIDPYINVIGIALLVLTIYFYWPFIVGAFAWESAAATTGELAEIATNVAGAAEKGAKIATGVSKLVASMVTGKIATIFVPALFMVQAALHYQVNCIELPQQLKYDLRIAQTRFGIGMKSSMSDAQLMDYAKKIHSEKVSTQIMLAMNALPVPGMIMGSLKGIADAFGITAAESIEHLTTQQTAELAAQLKNTAMNEFKDEAALGGGDATAEKGAWQTVKDYVAQKMKVIANITKLNTLNMNGTEAELRVLLSEYFVEMLGETPEVVSEMQNARIAFLDEEISKISTIIKTQFYEEVVVDAEGVRLTPEYKNWFRKMIEKHYLPKSKYGQILIEEGAFNDLRMGGFMPGKVRSQKQAALILISYLKDLQSEREVYVNFNHMFTMLKDSGLEGKELLSRFFAIFGDAEWARMRSLVDWHLKQLDKPFLAGIKPGWFSQTKWIGNIQKAFESYSELQGQLKSVHQRFWGVEADAYFSHVAAPGAANVVGNAADHAFDPNHAIVSKIEPNSGSQSGSKVWTDIFIPLEALR